MADVAFHSRRRTMKFPSFKFAAAGLALVATQAAAQISPVVIQGDVPSVAVSYADLNITVPAGRHTLEGRVARAAAGLCIDARPTPLDEYVAGRQCLSAAMSRARIDIDIAVARANNRLASAVRSIRVAAR
jgi:UrcA family protein